MTHGSLFDGFGGLRRGLEDAGFITKWKRDLIYGNDIETDNPSDFDRVDLISGGPSCRKTSHAASFQRGRTGFSHWPHMLRFVEVLRPSWVLVEQPLGGRVVIIQAALDLQRLGYGSAGRIIDSQHWVPQRRSRWFLIGRLGVKGMALWNQLYPHSERMERGQPEIDGEASSGAIAQSGIRYLGACPHCLPDGILARVSARKSACMGAGNAVTQPLAEWIGKRIIEVDKSA